MKLKFFKKFFLTTTLVILFSLTCITIILCFFVSNYLTDQKQKLLENNCHAVVDAVRKMDYETIKSKESETLFQTMGQVSEADIFITDKNGRVIMCSCDDWKVDGICVHNSQPVPMAVMKKITGGDYSETGTMDNHFSKVFYTHASLLYDKDHNSVGAVFSTLSPQSIRVFYNSILKLFLLSALAPLIVLFFAEYFISYRFTKPLRLMSEASRSMAKGDFSKRIPVNSDDEIGELSIAFNQMTNSLVQTESTRRRFIANVSHELKTPMTTIGGFIDGIVDGTIPPEKQHQYLQIVSNEIKRLSRLVQSMLDLAKLESGEQQIKRSTFSFFEMICTIVVSQEQRINSRGITISGLDKMEDVRVNADYDLLYQVVYNLVDNAVKFTNDNGNISFAIKVENGGMDFYIRNTGSGISAKDLPFVFERFYKSDRSRSVVKDSTGLGLYIANTIISIHGGKMYVQSVENDFTEFSFYLPQAQN